MRQLLNKSLNENKLRDSSIDFGLVTLCLSTLKPIEVYIKDIPEGHLIEYIMASCSLPGIKHEHIEGKTYLDGGIYSNLPIEMLINNSSIDELIVVDIHGPGVKRNITNIRNIPIITVEPSSSLGSIITFSNSLVKRNIYLGYKDAKRILN